MPETPSYIDDKGRTRWPENDRIGELLKELYAMLVVGGYDESHAARYPKLAYAVSRFEEPISEIAAAGRLRTIPGVGGTVEEILNELIATGTCAKMTEPAPESNYEPPPRSILEVAAISGLGAKTVRRLYAEYGIDSLAKLRIAIRDGTLDGFKGLGPKLRAAVLDG